MDYVTEIILKLESDQRPKENLKKRMSMMGFRSQEYSRRELLDVELQKSNRFINN